MSDLLNFAVAKMRTREAKLIDGLSFSRLSQSRNADEFLKLLAEFDYDMSEDIDKILADKLIETYDFIFEAVKENDALTPFLLRYDLFNIVLYLKAELKNELDSAELPFLKLGNIPKNTLVKSLKERMPLKPFPKELFDAFLKAREIYVNTNDIALAQISLETEGYEYILAQARDMKNEFVKNYFRTEADMKNLVNTLRLKKLNSDELIRKVLIQGGSVDVGKIAKVFNSPLDEIKNLFTFALSAASLEQAFAKFQSDEPFSAIEKELKVNLQSLLDKTKLNAFGIEPILAYLISKENEIKTVRELYYNVLAEKGR